MNIVDIIIILVILLSGIVGFKRGFTKELVCFLGVFVVIILGFILKDPVAEILYDNLPIFKINGLYSLSIYFYVVIAFILVTSVLLLIFKLLIVLTSLFEKLLNHTIILGIPSKILGFIIGLIEGVVWTFIILYVLNLPIFNIKDIKESTLKKAVLDDTPILSNINNDIVDSLKEISEIKDKKTRKEKEKETLDIMIKYHIIDETTAESLIKK